ncbi:sigma-70 family RNA polymerase sigma factor [Chroococcus sp. FPU101]|uniref:sigma-70 family RNA polymerase sigma factor n=1 Tax=Chroococcus sp. FPU101 TaxID=1974212 RepID=UPI001A8CB42D|nr:sigma-70 family RNA polymerase sigma factor [Chroococcus sp. FPU101]GFE69195.1 RNA polymerase ECF-type (group 3) sigma factor [Chroococcus sp. FPU101]
MNSDDSSDNPTLPISPTDTELFESLKAGQISALDTFYDRYGRLVYGLALQILKNSQEAEDLTQEIFLALWRKEQYDPSRGSVSSFLTTMTRCRAIDKLRSRGAFLNFLERWRRTQPTETFTNTPFERASYAERSQQVQNALAQLSPNQRQVLEMFYYEGLTYTEIAQRLKIPLGTVKTRSRLGLLKLRQTLEDFVR